MPNPSNYNNKESFMESCIPTLIHEGKKPDQAVAICESMWSNKNESKGDDEEEDE